MLALDAGLERGFSDGLEEMNLKIVLVGQDHRPQFLFLCPPGSLSPRSMFNFYSAKASDTCQMIYVKVPST